METDHIKPEGEGGTNDIDNAIPLCFECHAEVHMYNEKHPRGRKYKEEELRQHKEQWLKICRENPESLLDTPRIADPGPMSSLLTELEYNERVFRETEKQEDLMYETKQFDRSISEGILSMVDEELKETVMDAYALMKRANNYAPAIARFTKTGDKDEARSKAKKAHNEVQENLLTAVEKLREFLNAK